MACHHITTSEIQNLPRTGTMDVHREIHSGTGDSPQCLTVTSVRKSGPPKKHFFFVGGEGELTNFLRASLSLSFMFFFLKKDCVSNPEVARIPTAPFVDSFSR